MCHVMILLELNGLVVCSTKIEFESIITQNESRSHADIVFTNSTCFTKKLWKTISEQAVHLKTGARVLSLTWVSFSVSILLICYAYNTSLDAET